MLEELRALSEENKKRVLIIATIVIMVIIVGVWATYFNSIIMGTANQAAMEATTSVAMTSPTATAPAQANGLSLWQNIKNGFGSVVNIFKGSSHYTVQPQSN